MPSASHPAAVILSSAKRLSVEQLIAEDVALEKSCTDALSYVRTYEQLRGYHKQVQPNLVSFEAQQPAPRSGGTASATHSKSCAASRAMRCPV
jgi:hypothetical protein